MAHPPRIPVRLPWGTSVTYFLTICERDRKNAWANEGFFSGFRAAADKLTNQRLWFIRAAVVMPDHLHLLATPLQERDQPVGNLSAALKRWTRNQVSSPSWNWQSGSFDRLLRSTDTIERKWEYMRENPVRAGLVEQWQDWKWSLGLREYRDLELMMSGN